MIESSLVSFLNTNGVFVLFFGVLLYIYITERDRRFLYHIAGVFVITLFVTIILKELFDRPRPFEASPVVPLAGLTLFPSFPSSHAALAFALATSVALLRRKLGIFLLVLACLISVGRVVANVHYPSDMAFGVLVGVSTALFFDRFQVHILKKRKSRS